MTKKRYTSDIHRIYDDNEEIACADTMDDAEVIVDLLNEQDNRIEQLDAEVTAKSDEIYVLNERINELEDLLVPKCRTCRYLFDGHTTRDDYCTLKRQFIPNTYKDNCEYYWAFNIKKVGR